MPPSTARPIKPMSATSMKAMITIACPDCSRPARATPLTSDQHRSGPVDRVLAQVDGETLESRRRRVRPIQAYADRRLARRYLIARRQREAGVKVVAVRVELIVRIGRGVEVSARA